MFRISVIHAFFYNYSINCSNLVAHIFKFHYDISAVPLLSIVKVESVVKSIFKVFLIHYHLILVKSSILGNIFIYIDHLTKYMYLAIKIMTRSGSLAMVNMNRATGKPKAIKEHPKNSITVILLYECWLFYSICKKINVH